MKIKPSGALVSFSHGVKAAVDFWSSDDVQRKMQWHQACNVSRFNPEAGLARVKMMMRLGFDPMDQDKYAAGGMSALHMSAAEPRAMPLLRLLLDQRPMGAMLSDSENRLPADVACEHQNPKALALLAPKSDFGLREHPQDMEGLGVHVKFSPLTKACGALDPRCVEICLGHMGEEEVAAQALRAWRDLGSAKQVMEDPRLIWDGSSQDARALKCALLIAEKLPRTLGVSWLDEAMAKDSALEPVAFELGVARALLESREIGGSVLGAKSAASARALRM
jgi:hypothetical protein